MGMTTGFALIRNERRLTVQQVRETLAKRVKQLAAHMEDSCAWACLDSDRPWFQMGDAILPYTCSDEAALRRARELAALFEAPVLVCVVFDSDASLLAYSDPKKQVDAWRMAGRLEDDSDEEIPAEALSFPDFLLSNLIEDKQERLRQLWNTEFGFEESRIMELMELLGAPDWYEPENESVPTGTELIRVENIDV